ncbi:MAG: hypothetical protein ACOVOW_02720, partial [Spirosomataceae bacterium]
MAGSSSLYPLASQWITNTYAWFDASVIGQSNPIATGATYTITQTASVLAKSCGQTQPSPTVTVTIPNLKASIATPIAIIPANSTGVPLTVSNQNNPTVTPTAIWEK